MTILTLEDEAKLYWNINTFYATCDIYFCSLYFKNETLIMENTKYSYRKINSY